jgi:ribosomal protein S4
MVVKLQNKLSLYKKFELDIWGISRSTGFLNFRDKKLKNYYKKLFRGRLRNICSKYERICEFFYKLREIRFERFKARKRILTYSLLVEKRIPRRKRLNEKFVSIRVVKMFYLILKYRHFRKMSRKANGLEGNFESNFLYLLECRLVCVMYRSTLITNMFEAIKFVQSNNVWIDKIYRFYPNYYVKPLQLVGIRPILKGLFHWNLVRRLKLKTILFNCPRYIFMSYSFFTFFLKRYPCKKDLIFPIRIDVYKLTGYCK